MSTTSKINFTVTRIAAHSCPSDKNQSFLWDIATPGLGLRTTSAGAKSFVFQGKIHGNSIRLTIGSVSAWPIDKAKEEARRLQRLLDEGKDPRHEKLAQEKAYAVQKTEHRRKHMTFGEAWDTYVELRRPRWSERHYRDHVVLAQIGGEPKWRSKSLTKPGILAELRPYKLDEFTSTLIAEWLSRHGEERPTVAALAFRLLRAFIRWTTDIPEFQGLIPESTYQSRSVKDAVPRVSAKQGDVLQREQLSAWFTAVRNLPNPIVSTYLQGLLITGARREELAGLRWTDVDFQWRSLTIADKVEKNGRTIPLPPYLYQLLERLKQLNAIPPSPRQIKRMAKRGDVWSPSQWVFNSDISADGKIADATWSHKQALKNADLPHLTLHGLRRSFGTLCEWIEMPSGISAQIMGHKPSALVEKHYRRRPLDLLRSWHDKIEKWLLDEGGILQPTLSISRSSKVQTNQN
jgi:integrase